MSGVCWQRPSAAFHVASLALEEVQSLTFLLTARVYWLGKVDSKIRQGEGKEEKAPAY